MCAIQKKFLKWFGRQDWIRYGIRNVILRFFYNPRTIHSLEFETDLFGYKFRGNLNNFIEWKIYFFGAYEKQFLYLLRDLVANKKDPIFIDVGANIGQHSLFMSHYCKHVYSFEPLPSLSSCLKAIIKQNKITNISVYTIGLGSEERRLDFFAPQGSNRGTGSFIPSYNPDNRRIGKLKVVGGDEYLKKIGVEKVDLIKIDVEGFEKDVLDGLTNTIFEQRPAVFMEFSSTTQSTFKSKDNFMSMIPEGYKVYKVEVNKPFCIFFNIPDYELTGFDFARDEGYILFMPSDWSIA